MVTILSPVVRQKKGTYQQLLKDLNKEGYARVRVNGKIIRTDEEISLDRYKKQDIEIVIDRLASTDRSRLTEAVENALKKSEGLVLVAERMKKSPPTPRSWPARSAGLPLKNSSPACSRSTARLVPARTAMVLA